ncbi:tetratricopeptide (TPR) repeat protein [Kitasatospora sp. GAS204A]|uniref:tetratricopeptide repeat protein n=1 Tax=unclassified Kitasatospora TaxID=2633591 RepID=UPI002473BCEF|nr:tetratricopeptide repeat protein [Kitasatospora sp. GAS204B]MDH6120821.1 tetratricopeptide (TPR) repeat protein [Kitasatospora sp. GAS204B]
MAFDPARPPWFAGIRPAGGQVPEGCGMLLSDRLVLTCAHVVDPANPVEPPTGPVHVHFPFLAEHEPIPALVVPGGWHPRRDWSGDVAVLELSRPAPPGAEPAPLRRTDVDVFGHTFRCYGFPRGHESGGVPIRGEIVGYAEIDWLQLESTTPTGWTTEPGFSGGPVWNNTLRGVVGMVAARQKPEKADRRVGFAKSLDSIGRLWPALGPFVHDITAQEHRERLGRLLAVPLAAGELPRLAEVDPHDLGVSESKYTATGYEPYVARPSADRAVDAALAAGGFVLVTGRAKAGKSRTLHERLSRTHGGARLVVPRRDRNALEDLTRAGLPQTPEPVVVWLDDLHHYLLSGALDARALVLLLQQVPSCLVVGTLTYRHQDELRALDDEVGRAAREVLRRATVVTLDHTLAEDERREAARLYPQEDFSVRGIGEMLVAAPALEVRFDAGPESCPEGWLLVKAAADWSRMGAPTPLDEQTLRELFDEYRRWTTELDLEPGEAPFHDGLGWARDRAQAGIALLGRATDASGRPGYAAFPYLAEYLDAVGGAPAQVPDFAWAYAARTLSGTDLLTLAQAAIVRDREETAAELLAGIVDQGAEDVRAVAALMLSIIRLYQRKFTEAEELLRQPAASGLENVAELAQAELAGLLSARGQYETARDLLERAVAAQDPQVSLIAQVGLAGVLLQLGEAEQVERLLAAVLAYGVEEVGPRATARLGRLLVGEGSTAAVAPLGMGGPEDGKQVPARRPMGGGGEPADQPWTLSRAVGASASSSITGIARARLVGVLVHQGELDRAEELLRSVLADGDPLARPIAQASLGELLIVRGRYQEAAELLEVAVRAAGPLSVDAAQFALGIAWLLLGRLDDGLALLRQVVDAGHPNWGPEAMAHLGHWCGSAGRTEEADHWLRRSVASGHPVWARMGQVGLAFLLAGAEQQEEARRLLAEVAASDQRGLAPWAACLLGNLLLRMGRPDEAVAAYRRAIVFGRHEWSLAARINLALLLANPDVAAQQGGAAHDGAAFDGAAFDGAALGGAEEAAELLAEVAGSSHADLGPQAADLLGDLLVREARPDEAERAYRLAIDSGHPAWALAARIDLALLLVNLERFDESEVLLRELIASEHPVAAGTGMAFLGILLLQTGRWEEGRAHLVTAVGTATGTALQLARFHLAKRLIAEQEPDQAAELLREVIADEPSEATEAARATLGVLLRQRGEEDQALQVIAGAAESEDPEATMLAFVDAGEHLLEVGELQSAIELLEAARQLPGTASAPRAAALLGVARRALNQFAEARALLTEALDSGDASLEPMVRRYLGSTLFRLGEYARAEQVLLPVAHEEGNGHRPGALLLLAQILDTMPGRQEEARTWFEAASDCGDPEIERRARFDHALQLQRLGHRERAREILATLGADDADSAGGPDGADRLAAAGEPAAAVPPARTTAAAAATAAAAVVPARRAGAAEQDGAGSARSAGLPPAVLLLLAQLAEAEADPLEAAFWRARAGG